MANIKKHAGGRPIKFTEVIVEAVIDGIQQGLTLKAACKSAGISYSTLAAWMHRGKISKRNGTEDKFTALVERINGVNDAIWLKHRDSFFLT